MNINKCIHNPVLDCEYAGCDECPDFAEITDPSPDPDELFEVEREEKFIYD